LLVAPVLVLVVVLALVPALVPVVVLVSVPVSLQISALMRVAELVVVLDVISHQICCDSVSSHRICCDSVALVVQAFSAPHDYDFLVCVPDIVRDCAIHDHNVRALIVHIRDGLQHDPICRERRMQPSSCIAE
jgi:hypothetical protein